MSSKNKVAIITGSSQGIGAGIAEYLLGKGFYVYITYLRNEKLAKEKFGKNKNCKIIKLDVREEDSVNKLFATISKNSGRLDLLVTASSKNSGL